MPDFSHDSMRRINDVVQRIESRPTSKPQRSTPPRTVLPNRNAITTSSISARSGLVKGYGTVNILCDDGTGTGNDKVLTTGVKMYNPYTNTVNSGVYVTLVITDGLYMLSGASCANSN